MTRGLSTKGGVPMDPVSQWTPVSPSLFHFVLSTANLICARFVAFEDVVICLSYAALPAIICLRISLYGFFSFNAKI